MRRRLKADWGFSEEVYLHGSHSFVSVGVESCCNHESVQGILQNLGTRSCKSKKIKDLQSLSTAVKSFKSKSNSWQGRVHMALDSVGYGPLILDSVPSLLVFAN
jgi:hypothetical protein